MAYREYIGSRYIPIFGRKNEDSVEWDNLAPYEPLTVVTHEGNSYVSRQYVPTGIEITNKNYWVKWADFNAQLQYYIQQVENYSESIDTLNDALPISDFDETTVKNYVDNIKSDVDTDIVNLAAIIPGTEFNAQNTVKGYIDDTKNDIDTAITNLAAIIPGTEFNAQNTVKDYIDGIKDEIEITSVNQRYAKPICYGLISFDATNGMPEHPGAICEKSENEQIIISSLDNATNGGHWRTVSIKDNQDYFANALARTLYHANSITHDVKNNRVLVAPVYDRSVDPQNPTMPHFIMEFTTSGTFVKNINTPSSIMGVSYNHVNEKLYAFSYDGFIYEIGENDVLTQVIEIGHFTGNFNQDFAIKGDIWYISSPQSWIRYGKLSTGEQLGIIKVDNSTTFGHYTELDGMDFTANGNLIALGHTNIYGANAMAIVMEIPLADVHNVYCGNDNISRYESLTISGQTVYLNMASTALFDKYNIKHLDMLGILYELYPSCISVMVTSDAVMDTAYITGKYNTVLLTQNTTNEYKLEFTDYLRVECCEFSVSKCYLKVALPIYITRQTPHRLSFFNGFSIESTNTNAYLLSTNTIGQEVFTGGFTNVSNIVLYNGATTVLSGAKWYSTGATSVTPA